jgi:hypothetical protein
MIEPKLLHKLFERSSRQLALGIPKSVFNLLNNLLFEFIRKETPIPRNAWRIRPPCRIDNPLGEPIPDRGLCHIETPSQIGEEPTRLANLELGKYPLDPGNIPLIRHSLPRRQHAALISQIPISKPRRPLVLQYLGPSPNSLRFVFFFELILLFRHEITIVIIVFAKPFIPKPR